MSDPRITELIDRAFDYRGYVTLARRDGAKLVGFVYDRGPAHVELLDETAAHRIRLAVDQIADIELTGEDSAAKAQAIWERRRGALEPPERAPRGDREAGPVLVLVALPVELRSVAAALGARLRGTVVRGRLGEARAVGLALGIGGGAAQAVAAEQPRLVISCGFAGALDPSLAVGDLVLAWSVRDESGESIAATEPVLRAARQALATCAPVRVTEGEILCTTRIAASAGDKLALARPGRLAVDLESWPAAHAAVRAGVPWLALRVVLDPLDTDLPAFTREARRSYVAPALRHALRGPRAMVELAGLARRARTAGGSLAWAVRRLDAVVASLGAAESRS
jgi:nucleoside phosphorylase